MWTHQTLQIVLVAAMAPAAIGCGYTSQYVPPADGRARVVMMGSELAVVAAVEPSHRCLAAASTLAQGYSAPAGAPHVVEGGQFSTTNVSIDIGDARGLGKIRLPSLPHLPSAGSISRVVIPPGFGGGHFGGFHGGGGGGGGGGGNMGNMGKGAIIIPIIAMTALSWIALGLALGRPESEEATAASIDQVNAERDLTRLVGSPCDLQWAYP